MNMIYDVMILGAGPAGCQQLCMPAEAGCQYC